MKTNRYHFPAVYDGLREIEIIYIAVKSCEKGFGVGETVRGSIFSNRTPMF
jgi:hypothetical protein